MLSEFAEHLVEDHGKNAINHVLSQIKTAVSEGDDVLVDHLDALMQRVEELLDRTR